MNYFHQKNKMHFCEDIALDELAKKFGTPLFVYSANSIEENCRSFQEAFSSYDKVSVCYALKANSNLNLLSRIFSQGFGADIVSLGEYERARKAGLTTDKIVFSGVGKRDDEIEQTLSLGIKTLNVESRGELDTIQKIAKNLALVANIALRINPNIDAKTNPYIATGLKSTKFGIPEDEAFALIKVIKLWPNINLCGIACHIGSQITDIKPITEAAKRMGDIARELLRMGVRLKHLDMGGGLGIRYNNEKPISLEQYSEVLINAVRPLGLELVLEPGRAIVGNTGVLLTKVLNIKENPNKNFAITDAGMSELLRPCLYEAYHQIDQTTLTDENLDKGKLYDIVGPICETADFLGQERLMPRLNRGEYLVVWNCGAYGASMESHYNSRPFVAEIEVNRGEAKLIRRRETINDLWRNELME